MEPTPKPFERAWILQIPQVPVDTATRHRIPLAGTKRSANGRNYGCPFGASRRTYVLPTSMSGAIDRPRAFRSTSSSFQL